MIESFSIKGFKGLDGLELPKLSRIVLLGGRNNVGKTSVLEALLLPFDKVNPNLILRPLGWRGIASVPLTPDAQFGPMFRNYDLGQPVVLHGLIHGRQTTVTVQYNPDYGEAKAIAEATLDRSGNGVVRTHSGGRLRGALDISYAVAGETTQVAHLVLQTDGVVYSVDHVTTSPAGYGLYPATHPSNPTEVAVAFGQLDKQGRTAPVIAALQVVDPRLVGLSTIDDGAGAMVYGDIGIGRKLPISLMGQGMAKALALTAYLHTSGPGGLLLVDEIENGFHHSVMPNVWKAVALAARQNDCQVIATTHSQESIAAAHEAIGGDEEQDLTYIRLAREGEQVKAYTLSSEALEAAMEGWLEVR